MDENELTQTGQIEQDRAEIAPPVPPKPSKKQQKLDEDAAARQRARKRSGEDG